MLSNKSKTCWFELIYWGRILDAKGDIILDVRTAVLKSHWWKFSYALKADWIIFCMCAVSPRMKKPVSTLDHKMPSNCTDNPAWKGLIPNYFESFSYYWRKRNSLNTFFWPLCVAKRYTRTQTINRYLSVKVKLKIKEGQQQIPIVSKEGSIIGESCIGACGTTLTGTLAQSCSCLETSLTFATRPTSTHQRDYKENY